MIITPDRYGKSVLVNEIAREVFAEELDEAKKAGTLGYMARILAQVTLPHSKPTGNEYVKKNGYLTLSILSPSHIGLPYGGIPRVVLSWLTTEAIRTREREIVLGNNLSSFMAQVGLVPTGGRWGTIPRLQSQLRRLFVSEIICTYDTEFASLGTSLGVASEYQLWWDTKVPQQRCLFQSSVTLGEGFYKEIIDRPIPVNMEALKLLKRSPLALDLYVWLTYRMSYLRVPTTIPWEALHSQFGSDYGLTRSFKAKVPDALEKVVKIYSDAKFEIDSIGLRLSPSRPHVSKKPKVPITP